MTKLTTVNHPLTLAIERNIIQAGEDGSTYKSIMAEMNVGRTCAQNHLSMLEFLGRVYKVRRKQPDRQAFYYTYHASGDKLTLIPPPDEAPDLRPGSMPRRRTLRTWAPIKRRDELVAALFGPASEVAA